MIAVLLKLDDKYKPAKKTVQKQLSVTSMSAATGLWHLTGELPGAFKKSHTFSWTKSLRKCRGLSAILTIQTICVPSYHWALCELSSLLSDVPFKVNDIPHQLSNVTFSLCDRPLYGLSVLPPKKCHNKLTKSYWNKSFVSRTLQSFHNHSNWSMYLFSQTQSKRDVYRSLSFLLVIFDPSVHGHQSATWTRRAVREWQSSQRSHL